MINKHKSNKIKENSNTVRHLNNGTDHRHSKSRCDQSSPARRTIIILDGWSKLQQFLTSIARTQVWYLSVIYAKSFFHWIIGSVPYNTMVECSFAKLTDYHQTAEILYWDSVQTMEMKTIYWIKVLEWEGTCQFVVLFQHNQATDDNIL